MKEKDDRVMDLADEQKSSLKFFCVFDDKTGDFVELTVDEEKTNEKAEKKSSVKKPRKAKAQKEYTDILDTIKNKDIVKMSITVNINGSSEKYSTEQVDGSTAVILTKEQQIEKIQDAVKSFKNVVIVHSKEELKQLQEEFNKKQSKKVKSNKEDKEDKAVNSKEEKPEKTISAEKSKVYIRISEVDYESIKGQIDMSGIKISANRAKMKNGKEGINIVVDKQDAYKIKEIIVSNKKTVIQEIEGNVDWNEIKGSKNIHKNVTKEQLEKFQNINKDQFKYIAFENKGKYTIYADEKCNIDILERKSMKEIKKFIDERKDKGNSSKQNNKKKEVAR